MISSRTLFIATCLATLAYATVVSAQRPVHRFSTTYPNGLTDNLDDWVGCRSLERIGVAPDSPLPAGAPPHPEGTTWGDCLCTRDTVRLAAAIKGFAVEGVAYEPGDVEIEGTIYLHDAALYPGDPDKEAACGSLLGGPRIRDSVRIRGVSYGAESPTVNGTTIAIWTASYFGLPQPEPAKIVFEDLIFQNTGPAVQTGIGSFADVTLRNLDVHATSLAPRAPAGCPANAYQFAFHHRGSLRLDQVRAVSNIDSSVPLPGPETGCFLPGPARAMGIAIGLTEDLDVVIRESAFTLHDSKDSPLEDAVGLLAVFNAGSSIVIEETTIDADRGVSAILNGGPLVISESSITSRTAVQLDLTGPLFTFGNEIRLTGDSAGIRIGPGTDPSLLVQDVLTGMAATGLEIHGEAHHVIETDLFDLVAPIAIHLTATSRYIQVREVDGAPIVDEGTQNTIGD